MEQLWLPLAESDPFVTPPAAHLPAPDGSPAYEHFGFVVQDVPRQAAQWLRWLDRTTR